MFYLLMCNIDYKISNLYLHNIIILNIILADLLATKFENQNCQMKLIQRLSPLPLKENYDLRVIKFVYN